MNALDRIANSLEILAGKEKLLLQERKECELRRKVDEKLAPLRKELYEQEDMLRRENTKKLDSMREAILRKLQPEEDKIAKLKVWTLAGGKLKNLQDTIRARPIKRMLQTTQTLRKAA